MATSSSPPRRNPPRRFLYQSGLRAKYSRCVRKADTFSAEVGTFQGNLCPAASSASACRNTLFFLLKNLFSTHSPALIFSCFLFNQYSKGLRQGGGGGGGGGLPFAELPNCKSDGHGPRCQMLQIQRDAAALEGAATALETRR